MKITYTENPLRTKIELDEHEKKELWYKVKIEEMIDLMHSAHFHLEDEKNDYFDLTRARSEVDPDYYYSPKDKGEGTDTKSDLDKRVDVLVDMYINEGLLDVHCGDCTCVASSCIKCHAEHMVLGTYTTKGLGKHEGSKIAHTFDRWNKDKLVWENDFRNIHEAVDHLKNLSENWDEKMAKNPPEWEGWEAHAPRWKGEAKNAYEWLKIYRDTHFPLKEPVDPNTQTLENTRV